MKRNSERVYWMSNKEWYTLNDEKKCFELTEAAPERAHRSFAMWKQLPRKNLLQILRICRAHLF